MSLSNFGIDDPFEEVFPLLVEAAHNHCADRDLDVSVCYNYHRLYPYQRLFGWKGSAWRHGANYMESCAESARAGLNRVLISGSADYSLLALVLHAYRGEGVEPKITVLDLCEAPLTAIRWYAQRLSAHVKTVKASIFSYDGEGKFDVIATDQFLSQFPLRLAKQVIPVWHRALASSGKVITAQAITNIHRVFSAEEEKGFGDARLRQVNAVSKERLAQINIDRETLKKYVIEYQRDDERHIFTDANEVMELFSQQGFSVGQKGTIPRSRRRNSLDQKAHKTTDRIFIEACKS